MVGSGGEGECLVTAALELELTTTPREVAAARRFSVAAVAGLGGDVGAQDRVRMLVSELVTNVVLHAGTPSVVGIEDDGDWVRVLVTDGSPVAARTLQPGSDSTTGRGLRLLQALSTDSGSRSSDRISPAGKTVWFTVHKHTPDDAEESDVGAPLVPAGPVAALTMTQPDPRVVVTIPDPPHDPPDDRAGQWPQVRILRAPVRLWDRAAQHTADLIREFTLLQIGRDNGTTSREVPDELLRLVADLRARYAGSNTGQQAQFRAALESGQPTLDAVHPVPPGVAEACQTLLELLDAADEYCAAGAELLTLVSPPDQQAFRHWYLGEFVRQVNGHPPQPWPGPTS